MNRVLVSVEGQTEETFVRDVLRQYLWEFNIDLEPKIISTRPVKQGKNFKGGLTSFGKTRKEILRLLNDSNAVAVTTMYDLYQLPQDFPGQETCPAGDGRTKAEHLENAFQSNIGDRRFRPYLQVHEFEAVLFVDPEVTARTFIGKKDLTQELQNIRNGFLTPEDINDSPQTAPSKRILTLYPGYQKPLDGSIIALEVGLVSIRKECPHFNEWLTWLENIKS